MALGVASEVEREERAQTPRRSRFVSDLTTVPNLISFARVLLILAAAVLYFYGHRKLALGIGVLAGLTDLLDGLLARKLDQVTELGAILDRLSDLVFEGVALVAVVFFRLLSPAYLIAYLLREFVVLSARLYVAGRGGDVPTSIFGKLKTDFLAGAFLAIFASHAEVIPHDGLNEALFALGHVGIVGGLLFSYVSGGQYLRAFASAYASSGGDDEVHDGE